MSTAKRLHQSLTPEQYLASERDAAERHEYLDGHLYAMGGASDWHGQVTLSLASALFNRLSERV